MQVKEFASTMVMLALSLVFWFGADAISRSPLEGQVGADGFPKLLAVSLGVLVIIRLVQLVLAERRVRGGKSPGAPTESTSARTDSASWRPHLRAAGMIALGIGYIVILPTLGYLLSIALLLAAVALYNGRRASLGLAGVAIVGAGLLYVMFVRLLDVPLPAGLWEGLFAGVI
jgi:hypothetical protein